MPRRSRAAPAGARRPAGAPARPFTRDLLLVDWLTALVGGDYDGLLRRLAETQPAPGAWAAAVAQRAGCSIGAEVLAADARLAQHEARIARARPDFSLKYFQWLAALNVELFLTRYTRDAPALAAALEAHRQAHFAHLPPVAVDELRRLALFMATGSGKTLLLHVNLLQFLDHAPFAPNNVFLLTPGETLSAQHRAELAASGLLGLGVQVVEITKFYFDDGAARRKGGGVQTPLSSWAGPNLLLVDEGHKGTRADEARGPGSWRDIRESLAGLPGARAPVEGPPGFAFEYSATFAQVAGFSDGLHAEYAKSTVVDFGYARFWRDGYGKDFRVLNTRNAAAEDRLLMAGLLGYAQQWRAYEEYAALARTQDIAPPLAIFVGLKVKATDSEVARTLDFLHRVSADAALRERLVAEVLRDLREVQRELGGDALDFPLYADMPPAAVAADLARRVFRGGGALTVVAVGKDELGLRAAGDEADAFIGVVRVGAVAELKRELLRRGLADGGTERQVQSLFARLDEDPRLRFLVGARKFIEGWSSWRVASMGLLHVGGGEGSQVVQLFGRGVRLRGQGLSLKRIGPRAAPPLRVLETLNVFGLRADYMQEWLQTLSREGIERKRLWVELAPPDPPPSALGLRTLARARDAVDFAAVPVVFDADSAPPVVQTVATGATALAGLDAAPVALGGRSDPRPLPAMWIDDEALYLHALRFKRRMGWLNLAVPRAALARHLREKCKVDASADFFAPRDPASFARGAAVARACVEAALTRAYRAAQRVAERGSVVGVPLADDDPSFPWVERDGRRRLAYEIELETTDLVATELLRVLDQHRGGLVREENYRKAREAVADAVGLADVSAELEELLRASGHQMPDDDLDRPLPRLWCPEHVYRPLLIQHPARVDAGGQLDLLADRRVGWRSTPPALTDSEPRFVWDLRAFWKTHRDEPEWRDCAVYLLRNLSGRGLGLFAEHGFYPDFLLWLKRGDAQALALVDPKGLGNGGWPAEKLALLADLPRLVRDMPVRGFVVTTTPLARVQAGRPHETTDSLREQGVLFQEGGADIRHILVTLRGALAASKTP